MSIISFLLEFFKQPRQMGGVTPSSRALAQGIKETAAKFVQPGTRVVEIGAGTGAITKYLLELDCELVVIEPNQRLRAQLSRSFPNVRTISSAVQRIESDVLDEFRKGPLILVSSLPFGSLPKQDKVDIKSVFYDLLKTSHPAVLIQYTYTLGDPIQFEQQDISGGKEASILRNIPPASIWLYHYAGNDQQKDVKTSQVH